MTRTIETVVGRDGSTDFLYYTDLEDADPANPTVYPTGTTKYFCGASGAQTNIYWYSPAISGATGRTRAASRSASPPATCSTAACTSTTHRR